MFDPLPDLASDLEWMIQSGQVPRQVLVDALVHEYYLTIYQLALALLDDQKAARNASRQAITIALTDIYTYRGNEGIPVWLYGIAIHSCRRSLKRLNRRRMLKAAIPWFGKPSDLGESQPETELDSVAWLTIDALPEQERLVLFMHYLLDWNDSQISSVLNQPVELITDLLEQIRQKLLTAIWMPFRLADPGNRQSWDKRIDQFLKQNLLKRWPALQPVDNELDKVIHQALKHWQLVDTQQHIKSYGKEIALIGGIILLIIGASWGATQLWPESISYTANQPLEVTVLVTRLVYKTPQTRPVTGEPSSSVSSNLEKYQYIVQADDTLPEIASFLGVTTEKLLLFNRLPPETDIQAGQILLNPAALQYVDMPNFTPMPPVSLPPTLELENSGTYIIKRLVNNSGRSIHSVWFDALVIDYGPLGYIGPARVERVQAWLSKDQFLVLEGEQDQVDEVWLHFRGVTYNALPGKNLTQYLPMDHAIDVNFNPYLKIRLHSILDSQDLSLWSYKTLQVWKRENYVDRPSITINGVDENGKISLRFWLDASTGLVLRKQFLASDGQTLLKEVAIQHIFYNINLPQELFIPMLPWRGGFAQDYRGTVNEFTNNDPSRLQIPRRPYLPYTRPSPEANLSIPSSWLTFQYPHSLINLSKSIIPIGLFANGYYLGSTYFGDPWNTLCDRSPDGEKIAFINLSQRNEIRLLHWIKLSLHNNPFDTYALDQNPKQLAFAPDSTHLAIFGHYNAINQMGYLYILNIETQDVIYMGTFADIKSLVWSPDGRFLVFIARYQAAHYEHVIAMDVHTGETIYNAFVDFESNALPDWPRLDWGVEFPVEADGLEQCALPDTQ